MTAQTIEENKKREESQMGIVRRTFCGEGDVLALRSINEEEHSAEFIIATETPVRDRYYGPPTSLSMNGVNLKEYRKNPVVAYAHDLTRVVGRCENIRAEDGKLIATVIFDVDNEFAAGVWGQVKRGFLRAASAGFIVTKRKLVEEGKTDSKSGLVGPVEIATAWRLFEWSIVAVGADLGALGRDLEPVDEESTADDRGFTLKRAIVKSFSLKNCLKGEKGNV